MVLQTHGEDIHYALELNKIGIGVRAIAMGNAFTACDAEAVHIYWNSANLANLNKNELYASHIGLYNNIATHNVIVLAIPLPSGVGIGTSYHRFENENIPMYPTPQGTELERLTDFSKHLDGKNEGLFCNTQDEILVSIAKKYSLELPRNAFYSLPAPVYLSFGSSFKFYRNIILGYYGLNTNMDIGFLGTIGLVTNPKTKYAERSISFGFNLQDVLGTPVEWQYSNNNENTQLSYRTGISFMERTPWVNGHLIISMDIDRQYTKTFYWGIEYAYLEKYAIRAGLKDMQPTLGAGLTYRNFRIDYAFSFGSLDNTPLQIGLKIAF